MGAIAGIGREFLADRFGTRRAAARFLRYRLQATIGMHGARVEWDQVQRLVFVCSGNICRSPFAEAYAHDLGLAAVSAGLHCQGGASANDSALRVAKEFAVDLKSHSSQRIDDAALGVQDLTLYMEPGHLLEAAERGLHRDCQAALLGSFLSPRIPYIPDPYGTPDEYFRRCFSWIVSAIDSLSRKQP